MSRAAGPAVDQLAEEYGGQPVVFIEQDVDNTLGDRVSRWWRAFPDSDSIYLPLAMVNSGHQVSDGSIAFPSASTLEYHDAFKTMIDQELTRPPKAVIEAYNQRSGDTIEITAWFSIDDPAYINNVVVGVIVYENKHVLLTERFARAAVESYVYPDPFPGETTQVTLETEPLSGVDWSKLHTIVYVESIPDTGTSTEPFDMLQAVVANPMEFVVDPKHFTLMIDPDDASLQSFSPSLSGPPFLTWEAVENLDWLTVNPATAPIETPPTFTVVGEELAPGWQEGEVTLSAWSDDYAHTFSETISVRVYYGQQERLYLPVALR